MKVMHYIRNEIFMIIFSGMFLLCDMNANAQQIIKSSDTNDFRIGDSNDTIIYMMTWACSVLSSPRLTRKRRTWRSMAMSIVTTNVADASGSACRAASTCSSGMTTPTILCSRRMASRERRASMCSIFMTLSRDKYCKARRLPSIPLVLLPS